MRLEIIFECRGSDQTNLLYHEKVTVEVLLAIATELSRYHNIPLEEVNIRFLWIDRLGIK